MSGDSIEEAHDFKPKFGEDGLIAAVAVAAEGGEVLMLAWMNREALDLTLETGFAHYWSRSRQDLWKKGKTSGHFQRVREIRVDCDQDALLLVVDQEGDRACHTGRKSCFYRVLDKYGRSLKFL